MSSPESARLDLERAAAMFPAGAALNERLRVLRWIGPPGQSDDLEVSDASTGERRIAKLLSPAVADAAILAQLHREAGYAPGRHDRLFRVESVEALREGWHAIVSQPIRGSTLRDRLSAGPLGVELAVIVARGIASALASRHHTRRVHRHLTPALVVLEGLAPSVSVSLVDLGLAGAPADTDPALRPGLLILPAYVGPEHLVAPGAPIDERADVYSAGVILFEMLTGSTPFAARSESELAEMKLREPPPDPRSIRPDIPAPIAECVTRALSPSSRARQRDGRALVVELGGPNEAPPPSPRRTSSIAKAPPERARSTGSPGWLLGLLVALVVAGWTVRYVSFDSTVDLAGSRERASAGQPEADDPASSNGASSKDPPPVLAGSIAPSRAETELLFGGRPLRWWSRRLADLQSRGDGRLALFRSRAERNGLRIEEAAGRLTLAASPETLERLLRVRDSATPALEESTPPPDASAELLASFERSFARDETFQRSPRHPHVLLAPRPHHEEGVIRVRFMAGAAHDGDRPGLTRVAQYALFTASDREPYARLAIDLDRAGGAIQVETGVTESAITLRAPRTAFDDLAERFVRMCLSPNLDPERLEHVKRRARGSRDEADVEELSALLASLTVDRPGFVNDPKGHEASIDALTGRDVKAHLAAYMTPARARVVVAGAFDPARMRALLGSPSGGSPPPAERAPRIAPGTYQGRAALPVALVAYPVSLKSPEEIAAAHLAASAIEERELERGLRLGTAHDARAVLQHLPWLDFVLVAVFQDPLSRDARSDLGVEISSMFRDRTIDSTFARHKSQVIERLLAIDRDPALLARALSNHDGLEVIGPKVLGAVRAMEQDRWLALVRPWFDPSRLIRIERSERSQPKMERRR